MHIPRSTLLGVMVFVALVPGCVTDAAAQASTLALVPQGTRARAQAGAFTARADDPSAVSYNPAAIVALDGFQLQLGSQVAAPRSEYAGSNEPLVQERSLVVWDADLTWRPRRGARWALGLGLHAPIAHRQGWETMSWWQAPLFQTSRLELDVREVHPVVAFAVGGRVSLGLGVRRLDGRLRDHYQTPLGPVRSPVITYPLGERSAVATVGGWAADISLAVRGDRGGLGAVLSTGARLEGLAAVDVRIVRGLFPVNGPVVATSVAVLRGNGRAMSLDLPAELRVGAWSAADDAFRLEVDMAIRSWSHTGWRRPRVNASCGLGGCPRSLPRHWRTTAAVRLGMEVKVGRRVRLAAGTAYEPSPVTSETLEPGFPVGDAWLWAAGASYDFDRFGVDLALSREGYRELTEPAYERGTYTGGRRTLSLSTRWRF